MVRSPENYEDGLTVVLVQLQQLPPASEAHLDVHSTLNREVAGSLPASGTCGCGVIVAHCTVNAEETEHNRPATPTLQ